MRIPSSDDATGNRPGFVCNAVCVERGAEERGAEAHFDDVCAWCVSI